MSDDGKLNMLIAAEVRKLLFLRDMTMAQLAERAGMTQPYISRRLTGVTTLNVKDLVRIAAVLEVEVSDLLPAPSKINDVTRPSRAGAEGTAPVAGRSPTDRPTVPPALTPATQPRVRRHPETRLSSRVGQSAGQPGGRRTGRVPRPGA